METPSENELTTASTQVKILSVGQLNLWIKQLLEGELPAVWVKGELSNFKAHTSGHFYFSLKDATSQITAVMFRGANARLKFKPHDGLEVILRGKVSVYEPRGNYQIVCDMMEPVGAGALQKAYEQLKEKLKKEGLFESARKRAIPLFPKNIAVVTSPTGAAIRDILNIMSRRAPMISVLVVPTVVQGEAAAPKICEALELAYRIPNLDAIIIGRGGGSIEDLWAFNDEKLARMIVKSPVPVISAVGHEIDFTICDFVADLRAPTPSAAAELVAKSSQELSQKILGFRRMLDLAWNKKFHALTENVKNYRHRLVDPQKRLIDLRLRNDELLSRLENNWKFWIRSRKQDVTILTNRILNPRRLMQRSDQKLSYLKAQLYRSIQVQMEKSQAQLREKMGLLDSFSPFKVLERGYAIVKKENQILSSIQQVQLKDQIEIQIINGRIKAEVLDIQKNK
ncbi:MAG TPA: exodeoxyribonuclease VII large subunit [Pseudobdellovibrionaceae bacterium]|nr:exodeoxyribonuclease VII large subunit [Pseudobdellovibrionaceae bacterium]